MLSTRKIKRKIRSVNNIKKITRAMEMVSAAKLKKVQGKLVTLRPFAAKLQEVINNLYQSLPPELITHPLLKPKSGEGKHLLSTPTAGLPKALTLIVIASNKGLCSGYNMNLLKAASRFIEEQPDRAIKIMAIGKKTIDYFRLSACGHAQAGRLTAESRPIRDPVREAGKDGVGLVVSKANLIVSERPATPTAGLPKALILPAEVTMGTAREIIKPFIQDYEKGSTDEIWVVYTEFVNALVYRPRVRRLVPLSMEHRATSKEQKTDSTLGVYPGFGGALRSEFTPTKLGLPYGYLFEPEPHIIMDLLVPRYLEVTFYNILLDALASEHSARMLAMRNATENADEVISELTLSFNKARQASITKELLDIVGGAEAMR